MPTLSANGYQRAVLDFVRRRSGHGVVEATAGSGKTTTLVMVAQLLVDEVLGAEDRACFLAFNRSTAAELRSRLPPKVEASTLHSLGRQILADSRSTQLEMSEQKYERAALQLLSQGAAELDLPAATVAKCAAYLAELFGFARLELAPLADPERLAAIRRRYRLVAPLSGPDLLAIEKVLPALAKAGSEAATVDFTDMIYLPVKRALPTPRFAFICVDEAQDLSRMALGLVERLIAAGARALFVGDPYQAIYSFAGADSRSLERITESTAATRLPLSVSFRCPTRHVVLARRFSPHMLPAERAVLGAVSLVPAEYLARMVRPGDLVMARTNAPLPRLALEVAAAGNPVRVLGYDLAGEAKTLAGGMTFEGDSIKIEETVRVSAESQRSRLEDELLTSDELPAALERSEQAHKVLLLAIGSLRKQDRSCDHGSISLALDRLFATEGEHVLLSTIHKAKGREADRTFLLYPEQLGIGSGDERNASHEPADANANGHANGGATDSANGGTNVNADESADRNAEESAEANVLFVALTRARRELVLVESAPGALEARLRDSSRTNVSGLGKQWDDVLRLALIMSKRRRERGLSSGHEAARRVQDRRRQTGRGRRRTRWRCDRRRPDNR